MTARELASTLGAKKTGRDKWMARCPAHGDRRASLQITAGRTHVLLKCWSHDCAVVDICRALNIRVADLSYHARDKDALKLARGEQELADARESVIRRYRRVRAARLWRWYRVCTALAYLLMRHPEDDCLTACFELALSRSREASCPLPVSKEAPYCPFPHRKLLTGIRAEHVTPEIARYLKLPQKPL